jgi:hypothetical protein
MPQAMALERAAPAAGIAPQPRLECGQVSALAGAAGLACELAQSLHQYRIVARRAQRARGVAQGAVLATVGGLTQ